MGGVGQFAQPVIAVVVAVLLAWLVSLAVGWAVRRKQRRTTDPLWPSLQRRCRRPFRATLMLAAILAAAPQTGGDRRLGAVLPHILTVGLIASVTRLLVQLSGVVEDVAAERIQVDVADNRHARRVRTQIVVLLRVVAAILVFIGIAAAVMTFPQTRALGASFLASAGVLSVVAGLAAQATLSNILAGLQIALTDPIRIDDVVVVDGEWGRIKEMTLTYVVVRTWDSRRLILPVSWFTSNVFQNGTRHEARVLGSVLLHVDYTMPVEELRPQLQRVVEESVWWDGREAVLEVVDTTPSTMVVRGLVSSADAPSNWSLRCEVREQLLAYVHAPPGEPAESPRRGGERGPLAGSHAGCAGNSRVTTG